MKPASQTFNEEEECHSSESGWTMYIGSPSNGTEDDKLNVVDFVEEDDVRDQKNERNQEEEDDDTDDSMASDASSGPSHIFVRNAKITTGARYVNPKEKGNNGKGCSNNKANTKNGIKNQDKGESVFSAKGAKVPSNGGKVRKSIWKGKGK
ncbi:uncharacterized protein LOC107798949 [Nicotiana tabacum]|uniref:Uncharacterized protein LOC107798949 n=2 Tax=Nicotiana TaxID=4085 RepID=A0A1S4ALI9_TOBAC|nr:PREDICTED: uncharacterized protein LOC104217898 [Nicotiana sylvestris]XP_016477465.1 PREDICTED: uncharacterized protein LOC107798949 [Nicotiana tabacum]